VMGAGHETTASTLTAALYSVASHPEVDARVAAELAEVLGVGDEVSRRRLPKTQTKLHTLRDDGRHICWRVRLQHALLLLLWNSEGGRRVRAIRSSRQSLLAQVPRLTACVYCSGHKPDTRHGRQRTRTWRG